MAIAARKASTPFDTRKRARFLELLAQGNSVAHCARACAIHRTTAYAARAADPDFARAWAEAEEEGVEALEEEARRRALDGSDGLLMFLLKAKRPHVYRDRWRGVVIQPAGPSGAIDLSGFSVEELRILADFARRAGVGGDEATARQR
jgi:hypothetical protein